MTTKYEAFNWAKMIIGADATDQQIISATDIHRAFFHQTDRTARTPRQSRDEILENAILTLSDKQIKNLRANHDGQEHHHYDPAKIEPSEWSTITYTNRYGEITTESVPFSELEVNAIKQMREIIEPWDVWKGSGHTRDLKTQLVFPRNDDLQSRVTILDNLDRNYAILKGVVDFRYNRLEEEGIKEDVEKILDLMLTAFPEIAEIDEDELYELRHYRR